MRGAKRSRTAAVFFCILALPAVFAGCQTTTRSGLPRHINTVEVHIFQNKTMYKGIEATMARALIDRINADPVVRVSSNNGDALITGEITRVVRATLRETTTNEPGTVRITIFATFSFYDQVENRYIIEDENINSRVTGQFTGVYEAAYGADSEAGQRNAADALAAEIVRRTVGMW